MKLTKQKIEDEFVFMISRLFLSSIIFTICFYIYANHLYPRIDIITLVLWMAISALNYAITETWGLIILIPSSLFFLARVICNKYSRKSTEHQYYYTLGTMPIILILYILIVPIFFSCQANYKTGYYKTQYQACFGKQDGILDGGDYSSESIKNADFNSFTVFFHDNQNNRDFYAKDKNKVYYSFYKPCDDCLITQYLDVEKGIEGADPSTFEVFEDNYAKDKNHVYKNGEVVEGADPETFEVSEE